MNVNKVCRLCLSHLHDEIQTHSLLDPVYSIMLSGLAAIQVDNDISLSTVSCSQCVKDLEFSYKFHQNIIKCDQILRQQIVSTAHLLKIKEVCEEESQVESFNDYLTQNDLYLQQSDIKMVKCEKGYDSDESDGHKIESCPNETDGNVLTISNATQIAAPESTEKRKCSICLKEIICDEVKEHITMHFRKKQTCLDCNTVVGDVKAYQKHIEENHNHVAKSESQCSQCPASFKYKAFYYAHIKAHYELMIPHDVKKNLEKYKSPSKRQITLPDRKRWKYSRMSSCSICFAKVTAYNMNCHMKIHTTGQQICEVCGSVLRNVVSLRTHLFHVHNNKRLCCDLCGKVFKEKSYLDLHKKKHNNTKEHICELCGKQFFTKDRVNQHVRRVHMRLRPHKCNVCTKDFYSLYGLKTHMRLHTNETPYKCEVCGDAFKQSVSLRTHKRSKHNIYEEETVPCKACDKKFSTEHALTSHMRVHN